jgi:hypothetical protein
MKKLICVFVFLNLMGCAVNGFEKYYAPRLGIEALRPRLLPATGAPSVYTYSDTPKEDVLRAQEAGYVQLGTSNFYGPPKTMTSSELLTQAKNVGASMVLIHSQYKDTISGSIPYTVANPPQISTVNTSGTVNAYGTGGYATGNYSGQSTITSPGGTTTYNMPYSVSRNDMVATFWAKLDPATIRLGVIYAPLPAEVRTRLERNTGLIAIGIIQQSPAFRANILRGDILLKIGGEDVVDVPSFDAQIHKFAGQTVKIELIRGETPKTVELTLNVGRG